MTIATLRQMQLGSLVSGSPHAPIERAQFETFFAEWFPRVHGFASARLVDRSAAEAATRATLEAAVRAGLVGAGAAVAPRLLAIASAAVARQRRHSRVRHANAAVLSRDRRGASMGRS